MKKVQANELAEILVALGYKGAKRWFSSNHWKRKVGENCEKLPDLFEGIDSVDLSEDQEGQLTEILTAIENDDEVKVVFDEEDEEDEEEAPKKKTTRRSSKAKTTKKKPAAKEEEEDEEEDDEEEEDEEEAPPKKKKTTRRSSKAKTTKKKPAPLAADDWVTVANPQEEDGEWVGQITEINDDYAMVFFPEEDAEYEEPLDCLTKTEAPKTKKKTTKKKSSGAVKKAKGPGVIGTIVEVLCKASSRKPVTKEGILEVLCERFPDRSEDSMKATINVQVPNRINRERKGMEVEKNNKGYWIKQTA